MCVDPGLNKSNRTLTLVPKQINTFQREDEAVQATESCAVQENHIVQENERMDFWCGTSKSYQ